MEIDKNTRAVVKNSLTNDHYETCPGNRGVVVRSGSATLTGPPPWAAYSYEEECMSYVRTLPEALAAAAAKLEGIGSGMAAQNAAAAAPTTAIAPAAADQVSALQATQFTAFGNLYQSVSAQAQAIHQQLVTTLGTSGGSYGEAEATNQAAAASTPLSGILGLFSTPGTSGGALSFGINGTQNFTAAASDLISTASIGTLPGYGAPAAGGSVAGATGLAGVSASGAAVPAGSVGLGGVGAAPVLASAGSASSVGKLSVPPAWVAGEAAPAVTTTPATLVGQGWTSAAPGGAPVSTVPAGMPAVATAGKAAGLGAPRYGVKPTVMPKPAVV
jgi:hypothetical protein